jgi:hypothetical protein
MSFFDAAVRVLGEAGRPLTTKEITDKALRRGLIEPAGKTPEASMSAALYMHVKSAPSARIRRLYEAGHGRARRGSVRWALA